MLSDLLLRDFVLAPIVLNAQYIVGSGNVGEERYDYEPKPHYMEALRSTALVSLATENGMNDASQG
jgi:hypothetical protein